ncbi:MAG: ribosome maturation factor RimM [Enterobacteriaceae bacterium PSpyr]|nr:MAG: ribosome maturation factor RimM [Enterobacteriaceae bacterium PSpyr]
MKNIPKNPIIIGKINNNYNSKELFNFFLYNNKKENFLKYKTLYIKKKKWNIILLNYYIIKKKKIIIKIKNVNNNKIKLLNNNYIYIDFKKKNKLNYYLEDILKCKIINYNNFKLGQIKKIYNTKLNYIILIIKKKKKILIPFIIKKIIKIIDFNLKIIKLNLNF